MREKYKYKTLTSKTVLHTKLFKVFEEKIELPDGETTTFYRREISPYSIIVPILDSKFVMTRQYRHGTGEISEEFPMGRVVGKGPSEAAIIELKEETGYTAEKITQLGKTIISPSWQNLEGHFFLAENLVAGKQELEDDEFIDVFTISQSELEKRIKAGDVRDNSTILALYFYKSYREGQ